MFCKNMKLIFIAATINIFLVGQASSLSMDERKKATLFKSYTYGQPISDFSVQNGYEDCSQEAGKSARCSENIDFMGHKFSIVFLFSKDMLSSVSLVAPYDDEIYKTVMASLPKNGFNLILMQGKTERLDMVEVIKNDGKDNFISKVSAFESVNLSSGQLTYIFLELPIKNIMEYKNAVEATRSMPINTREIDFILSQDANESSLIISFSLPRIFYSEVQASGKISQEKF